MKKIIKYICHPKDTLVCMMNKNFFFFVPDKIYLKWKYRLIIAKKLDLKNPKLLSEKLQWLKLYDRNPIYTKMVDKYEAREYIKDKAGEKYLIPLIGIYDKFDEIDFDKLPNQFVMKCTHDSGGLVICKDKKQLDLKKARKKINKYLKRKYFYVHREWPYKNVKPRIIIEKYMENKNKEDLKEYNFFCFNGVPEMIDIAKSLSKNIPCLRVDLYLCNDKIYIGELTFSHFAGFTKFEPKEYETILGNYIKIGGKRNEKK